jgi:propionyl-CoA carboxylase alpha chain
LAALVAHPKFAAGDMTTNFIADEYPDGFHPQDLPSEDSTIQIAVAASVHRAYQQRAAEISGQTPDHERQVSDDWVVVLKDGEHPVTVRVAADGFFVIIEGTTHELQTDWKLGETLMRGNLDGRNICIQVERQNISYRLTHAGSQDDILVLSPRHAELNTHMLVKEPPDTSKLLLSPMPGLLVSVAVESGQEIKSGEELAVIEAMKMENVLRAERDGRISTVKAAAGDSLAVDQIIMEFE